MQLATMMGALLLARATRGDAVSNEILDAARARLTTDDATRRPGAGAKTAAPGAGWRAMTAAHTGQPVHACTTPG